MLLQQIEYRKVGAPFKYLPYQLDAKVQEYKIWAQNQTFEKVIFDQRSGEQKSVFLKCPLTIQQFCLYIGISYKTFKQYFNKDYPTDTNDYSIEVNEQLSTIFAHVHEYIQQNQFAGAILNEYNANIVSRINGLQDTVNVESKQNLQPVTINILGSDMNLKSLYSDIQETISID